jgi:ParB family transcriptional regulator, chromosome partitioning protein
MTTTRTAAAEKLSGKVGTSREKPADVSKDKEKAEKRRALGRGLESLLPGPRMVAGSAATAVDTRATGSVRVETPVHASGVAADHGVPHFVRDPMGEGGGSGSMAAAESTSAAAVEVRGDSQAGAAAHPEAAVQNGTVWRVQNETVWRTAASAPREPASGVIAEMQAGLLPSNMVSSIPLDHIDKNPYQTRYLFDQELLEELADSIRVNGVVQPVVVRPAEEEGRYVLILGERRCRASKMAGKESVPAIVRRVSEQQAAEMTVIENLQRQDLNCLEQAEAFRLLSKEFNLTQEEIGARVGMSRESVSNYMRLLRLPQEMLQYLANGQIGFSEAREILRLDDATKIPALAEEIVNKHMSVGQIEMMVSRMNGWLDPVPGTAGQEIKKAGSRWQDPNVRAAQLELERTLGVRVRIRDNKGKGKILIEYSNVDDYERVVGMLRGTKG